MSSSLMANRPKCHGPETKLISFKFFPAGNSGTTPLTIVGDRKLVSSVVRNGSAGEFLVTMRDNYRNVTVTHSMQMAAATDIKTQMATMSNENTGTPLTFLIRTLAVATPTEVAANANNAVHIQIISIDSSAEEV